MGEKYTLHHIYSELAIALRLIDEQQGKIMQLELDIESKFIRPVPIVREIIKAARDRGARVSFPVRYIFACGIPSRAVSASVFLARE